MTYTAAQRLDRLPEATFHRRMALMIGAGLFFDGFDLYLASGVMVALTSSGWATMGGNANFASAGALGTLIGACVAGWLGDKFGRKFTFQFNLILFGLTSIAAALAPSMFWLVIFRFVMGIGLGAEIVVGYATISEFVPPAKRGKWGAVLFFLATASLLVANVVSFLVIPAFGWRWMFAIAGVGGLLVWVLRQKMPESPRWLESVGRKEEADRILDQIEADIVRETGRPLPTPQPVRAVARSSGHRFGDLFKPPLLRATFLGIVLNVVALASLYGFIIWLPTFLVKQGLSMSASLGHAALMSVGSLVGVVLAGQVADKWSRKNWIVLVSLISAALAWAYSGASSVTMATWMGVLLMTSFYFGSTMGFSTYVPEIFPTDVRLRGAGVGSAARPRPSIFAPQAVAVLFAFNGANGVVYTVIGMIVLQAILVAWFGIETTRRSLDESFDAGEAAAEPAAFEAGQVPRH